MNNSEIMIVKVMFCKFHSTLDILCDIDYVSNSLEELSQAT